MLYPLKVVFLKSRVGSALHRRWMARKGHPLRPAEQYIRIHAPGRSFLDVGGMWNINGAHSFAAEAAGATRVVCIDLNVTPEFEETKRRLSSKVEFVGGDATQEGTLRAAGAADVVWCWGVLYHVPDPLGLLLSLRRVCGSTLVLETLTVPEIPGAVNAGVYFPMMDPAARRIWDTTARGSASIQYAITVDYEPQYGYSNNFWGLSVSAVRSLLRTAGFRVNDVSPSAHGVFRHVFTCTAVPWTDAFSAESG